MIERKDLDRLIAAEKRIREEIFPPGGFLGRIRSPGRRASRVLCEELGWLAHERPDFWRDLQEGSEELKEYRQTQSDFFKDIRSLIDSESAAFQKLGIGTEASAAVLQWVFQAIQMVEERGEEPNTETLKNLQNRLSIAAALVCEAARGPLRRVFENVVSLKGIRIVSGAAVAGANVAVAHFDFGVVSWKSLSIGYLVMKADVEGIIKIFDPKDGS